MSKLDEVDFVQKFIPVYKAIKKVSSSDIVVKGKEYNRLCGCTLDFLVYIINQQSPKKN
jgi:hypothetical protein